MYVCVCAGVTDQQIIDAAKTSTSADSLAAQLGVGENCGSCLDFFYELAMGEGLPLVAVETKEVVFERVLLTA